MLTRAPLAPRSQRRTKRARARPCGRKTRGRRGASAPRQARIAYSYFTARDRKARGGARGGAAGAGAGAGAGAAGAHRRCAARRDHARTAEAARVRVTWCASRSATCAQSITSGRSALRRERARVGGRVWGDLAPARAVRSETDPRKEGARARARAPPRRGQPQQRHLRARCALPRLLSFVPPRAPQQRGGGRCLPGRGGRGGGQAAQRTSAGPGSGWRHAGRCANLCAPGRGLARRRAHAEPREHRRGPRVRSAAVGAAQAREHVEGGV